MAHINRKNRTATLTLAESTVLASKQAEHDYGPEAYRVNREMLEQVQDVADELGRPIEVFACKRHGGYIVTVVEPRDERDGLGYNAPRCSFD